MPLADDGDIVRGLGFVTMYAAHIEEDIDNILRMLEPVAKFDEKKQRWSISGKIKHAIKLVRKLKSNELKGLPEALKGALKLFEQRNEFVHGRVYVGLDRVDYIRSGRPNSPTKSITSAELYDLANQFWEYRSNLAGPQLFRMPRAIKLYLDGNP
ncbi:MAG: hypothetical protein GY807_01875 [Gammaproteobacteria bacterium]|nr:hypothetical protein [Gammaproteobacteria bacterium]